MQTLEREQSIGHFASHIAVKFAMTAVAVLCLFAAPASAQTERYEIMAPAGPGGGTDGVARAVQQALTEAGVASNVQVYNVPGAGGLVGLAQFIETKAGDPSALIIGGYVMIGSILTNNSPVGLQDLTPIARLKGEPEAIVVPTASPIQSIDELVEQLKSDPSSISIAGGAAGGVDHILAGLLAQAAGVDPTQVNYIAFSGGGEALAALLGNQVTAGISGVSEFEGQIAGGTLRLLAVSSEEPMPGVDAPTLRAAGYDVAVENWHMIAAAPGLTDEQTAAITADFDALAKSDAWRATVERNSWIDRYLSGAPFAERLAAEIAATREVLIKIGLVKE